MRVFPELYKVGKVVNRGLHGDEQNIFSQNSDPNGH